MQKQTNGKSDFCIPSMAHECLCLSSLTCLHKLHQITAFFLSTKQVALMTPTPTAVDVMISSEDNNA